MDTRTTFFYKKYGINRHQKGKSNGIIFIINNFLDFRMFLYSTLRMILNYFIKYITKWFDIPFCFMQYVCKKFR